MQGMLRFVNEKLEIDSLSDDDRDIGPGVDRADVRPTDPMPVIRSRDGTTVVEVRRWGFLRMVPGAPDRVTRLPGRLVKKALFNAKSETAPVLRTFRDAFAARRCLIPMTSWFEWPERETAAKPKKQKVEIAPRTRGIVLAAGLFETSAAPDTGLAVETFTMLTTTPTEFLGTVHDRAPLIVPPSHWLDWLEGDAAQAQALVGIPPDSGAFDVEDV